MKVSEPSFPRSKSQRYCTTWGNIAQAAESLGGFTTRSELKMFSGCRLRKLGMSVFTENTGKPG
jgi:hypothetical protein